MVDILAEMMENGQIIVLHFIVMKDIILTLF